MQQAVPVGFGLLRKITRNEAKNFRDRSSENSSGQPALKCSSPPIFSRGKIVLEVKNLNVSIGGRKILDDLDLTVGDGEVAALMGPNGSGKSTLSHVIAGRKDYIAETGDVLLNGESILNLEPEARAAKGLFLAFQYPVEIPGVATLTFLKAALNAQRKQRGQEELSTPAFMKCVRASAGELEINQDMLKRALNAGFSGGEKKRMEILQMALLEPDFAILDETDSGLDIDALRVVADGVNALRSPKRGFLIITHYQRVLNHVVPDTVHVMAQGRIVRSGGEELAVELEKSGYRDYVAEPAVA
jgi:Fe-S cluster assembly ATP-binding protein